MSEKMIRTSDRCQSLARGRRGRSTRRTSPMDAQTVIVVGQEDLLGPLVEALAGHGLAAVALTPGALPLQIRQQAAAFVLVGLPGDSAARMIRQLKQSAGDRLPPI